MLFSAIEVEVNEKGNLFINARGSRRASPEWSVMIRPDGSGVLYMQGSELALPASRKMSKQEVDLIAGKKPKKWCSDSACRLMGLTQHEFGKGCRLF